MARKLQFLRGLRAVMPPLSVGEPALATDEQKLYIGTSGGNKPVSMDGHTHAGMTFFGTCTSAAATVAKTVAASGFVLNLGALIAVKFNNANTAANPTLNVNSTGAKPMFNGQTGQNVLPSDIAAGATALFVYDGVNWVLQNPVVQRVKLVNNVTVTIPILGQAALLLPSNFGSYKSLTVSVTVLPLDTTDTTAVAIAMAIGTGATPVALEFQRSLHGNRNAGAVLATLYRNPGYGCNGFVAVSTPGQTSPASLSWVGLIGSIGTPRAAEAWDRITLTDTRNDVKMAASAIIDIWGDL